MRKRLVAYWTPTDPSVDVSYEELRRFLSVRLPSYMVPSAGMALAALPLTGNGKLDRDALPEPDGLGGSPKDAADEPKPGLEQRVAALWQEVLKVASIGRNDNFFQLGGHSMLAMQLLARIEKEFQVVLPFRVLFERKTVADLAAAIAEARQAQPSELEPPPATPRAGDLLDRLEGLSDEEVDALLRNS